MGYLNETTGIVGGILPVPHDSVRIEMGPLEPNRLYLLYEGTQDALLAAGVIDPLMAGMLDSQTAGRDVRLRPYTQQTLPNGVLKITRTLATIKDASDLPGIRGGAINLSSLRSRRSHLRAV